MLLISIAMKGQFILLYNPLVNNYVASHWICQVFMGFTFFILMLGLKFLENMGSVIMN